MLQNFELQNKRCQGKVVLMRVDFNVPLDQNQQIIDDSRLVASLPSIRWILSQGASLILMSHLGRPKGQKDPKLSLAPCAKRLQELLGSPVLFAGDCIGDEVQKKVAALKPKEVLLLENLRFYKGEEHPQEDPLFVKKLASYGDLYINDAFGTVHRAHASTALIANYFPGKAGFGFLMKKEIDFLSKVIKEPKRPFIAVIGGAKVSSKIGILNVLIEKVDALLIGGAMAYTFLKAKECQIGDSFVEEAWVEEAKKVMEKCKKKGISFKLPLDLVVAQEIKQESASFTVSTEQGIPLGFQGVDIGPVTVQEFTNSCKKAGMVFWNGPLGVFEVPNFSKGTVDFAKRLAEVKTTVIIGGGDLVAAVKQSKVADQMTHISTGGGACLEFIEKGTLPGIEAIFLSNVSC